MRCNHLNRKYWPIYRDGGIFGSPVKYYRLCPLCFREIEITDKDEIEVAKSKDIHAEDR